VDLRHLRYFAAVADTGGFSRAAAQLRVSQPALWRQVRQLERDLGVRLFDRIGRQVRITAQGEDLLAQSRDLLARAEALGERARAFGAGQTGVLGLGATPQTLESLAGFLAPAARTGRPRAPARAAARQGTSEIISTHRLAKPLTLLPALASSSLLNRPSTSRAEGQILAWRLRPENAGGARSASGEPRHQRRGHV
jgi:DNA-binding transcriptional LysR family regulator